MAHLVDESHQDHRRLRCRRLLFRCWHRGTQESDLILGKFAETHLADFDDSQFDRLEALLDCIDPDLFDWIIGGFAPPKEYDHDVMRLLRCFARRRRNMTN
jgi:antitoxin CptB